MLADVVDSSTFNPTAAAAPNSTKPPDDPGADTKFDGTNAPEPAAPVTNGTPGKPDGNNDNPPANADTGANTTCEEPANENNPANGPNTESVDGDEPPLTPAGPPNPPDAGPAFATDDD
jgi:hypothetical protein